jgi:alpha-galactosidase
MKRAKGLNMKHPVQVRSWALFCLGVIGLAVTRDAAATTFISPEEMQQKSRWVQERLLDAKSAQLPFFFRYDGQASDKLLHTWSKKIQTKRLDDSRVQHTFTWTDSRTGLEVRCVAIDYVTFPVVEWTTFFKNSGKKDSPILQDIRGLDATFQESENGDFTLHSIKGDCCAVDNYQPSHYTLGPGASRGFAPAGGRPTNGPNGWPYYRVQFPGGGLILAVGWPGQWATSFVREDTDGLRIRAGQERTHLSLKAGEEVRTPLIALLFWRGSDSIRAQNLWRRWFLAFNIPRHQGKLPPSETWGTSPKGKVGIGSGLRRFIKQA